MRLSRLRYACSTLLVLAPLSLEAQGDIPNNQRIRWASPPTVLDSTSIQLRIVGFGTGQPVAALICFWNGSEVVSGADGEVRVAGLRQTNTWVSVVASHYEATSLIFHPGKRGRSFATVRLVPSGTAPARPTCRDAVWQVSPGAQADTADILAAVGDVWRAERTRAEASALECRRRQPPAAFCVTPVSGERQWYASADEVAWVDRVALAFGEGSVTVATSRPYCTELHERLVSVRMRMLSPDSGMVYVERSCEDRASPQAPPSVHEVHGFSVRRSPTGWRALLTEHATS